MSPEEKAQAVRDFLASTDRFVARRTELDQGVHECEGGLLIVIQNSLSQDNRVLIPILPGTDPDRIVKGDDLILKVCSVHESSKEKDIN